MGQKQYLDIWQVAATKAGIMCKLHPCARRGSRLRWRRRIKVVELGHCRLLLVDSAAWRRRARGIRQSRVRSVPAAAAVPAAREPAGCVAEAATTAAAALLLSCAAAAAASGVTPASVGPVAAHLVSSLSPLATATVAACRIARRVAGPHSAPTAGIPAAAAASGLAAAKAAADISTRLVPAVGLCRGAGFPGAAVISACPAVAGAAAAAAAPASKLVAAEALVAPRAAAVVSAPAAAALAAPAAGPADGSNQRFKVVVSLCAQIALKSSDLSLGHRDHRCSLASG